MRQGALFSCLEELDPTTYPALRAPGGPIQSHHDEVGRRRNLGGVVVPRRLAIVIWLLGFVWSLGFGGWNLERDTGILVLPVSRSNGQSFSLLTADTCRGNAP